MIPILAPNHALTQIQYHNMRQPHSGEKTLLPLMTHIKHTPRYDAGKLLDWNFHPLEVASR